MFESGLEAFLGIEVFVLVDVVGIEEPVGVEVIEAHVGGETDEQGHETGGLLSGKTVIEFLTRLIRYVALVGIVEGMGTDELLLYAIEEFDAALFAFVVVHKEVGFRIKKIKILSFRRPDIANLQIMRYLCSRFVQAKPVHNITLINNN